MGGSASNPYDDEAQKRTRDIMNETVVAFNKEYLLSLTYYLVDKVKHATAHSGSADEKKRSLTVDPSPQRAHMEGFITKQGVIYQTWKRRYFVVNHDFTIDYHESKETKEQGKPPKGTVNLNGYWIDDFESRALTIHCRHPRRRNWYFAADDEKQYQVWKEMFALCTRFAPSPMNPDPFLSKVYQRAYLKMYSRYWGWTSRFYITGGEQEMIVELIMRRLRWSVLYRVYSKIGGGAKVHAMMRATIDRQVLDIVDSGAGSCWVSTCEWREKLKGPMEESLTVNAAAIFEVQRRLKDGVRPKLLVTVNPLMERIGRPLLAQALPLIMAPLADAHIAGLKTYAAGSKLLDGKWDDTTIRQDINQSLHTDLTDARTLLWTMEHTESMKSVTKPPAFSSGVEITDKKEEERSNYHLSWRLSDEIEAMLRNSFYTLSIDKAARVTATKLLADTKRLLSEQYESFLRSVVQPRLIVAANGTIIETCKDIDLQIPDVVKAFINSDDLCTDIIQDECYTVIQQHLAKELPLQLERIDAEFATIFA